MLELSIQDHPAITIYKKLNKRKRFVSKDIMFGILAKISCLPRAKRPVRIEVFGLNFKDRDKFAVTFLPIIKGHS